MSYIHKIFFIIALIFISSYSHPLCAQQNYFNVPSGEITQNKVWFVQHQINFNHGLYQNNLTVDRGIGKGMELGFNIFSMDVNTKPYWHIEKNLNHPVLPLSPLVLINFQKSWKVKSFNISLGAQGGPGTIFHKGINPAGWQYGLINKTFEKNWMFSAGYYLGNFHYLGNGSKYGFMFGFDCKVFESFKNKTSIHINADIISGTNNISVMVPGLALSFGKHFIVSAGRQIPYPGSTASKGGVVEFTWK